MIHGKPSRPVFGALTLAGWALALLPATAPLAPASGAPVVGVMTHFAQGWDPYLVGPISEGGMMNVRDELYWQSVEPQAGKFAFPASYDRYMSALGAEGISPLVELDFANKAYDGGMTPYTAAGFAAYARYGVEVLRHYGAQVKAVEIWNEYNGSFCAGPAANDRSGTYTKMLQVAYTALKAERPDLLVAGASTAGAPLPYLERLFSLGALSFMDAVSIHPYRFDSEPEGIESDVAAVRDLILRYNQGHPKPIWVTEIGWGTKPASAPGDLVIDETTQASFLVRGYALLMSAGVERIYWYLFRDYDGTPTMGLVRSDSASSPKKAYTAMKTMVSEIGGAQFIRRESTPPDFYSIQFAREDGTPVRVIWSLQARTINVPPTCRVIGMLGGELGPGATVAVGSEPIFVEGPLTGLPAPDPNAPKVIADSVRGFSETQGQQGWSYGMFVGDTGPFVALVDFHTTDWKREWYSQYPYLSITDVDQHPSVAAASAPVYVVRRWTASSGGSVRVGATFRCGAQGDGVNVRVLRDGQQLFYSVIGGPNQAVARYDGTLSVAPGNTLDFAVGPGSRGDANYDATELSATITTNP